ncbi:MAG: FAD-binding oxidoreductase, partial [Pseudomonadota bacterium]
MTVIVKQLVDVLGTSAVLTGDDLAGRSAGIWSSEPLRALALVRPSSTEEVAAVLRICNEAGQAVVPAGGMTGLAEGHESCDSDVVLSLERMNRIEPCDTRARTLTVEAGAILQNVQDAASDAGLMFPLDLGARASCTIGGNIATNAGGVRVLRYGMMRDLVLGLEAVLADGTVINSMFDMLKNNTGYDLRQMFLGSEGTLGVVTRAVLRLYEAPVSIETVLVAVPSWENVMRLLRYADGALAGGLVAYEVLWRNFYELNTGEHSTLSSPLETESPYYVIIDAFIADAETGREKLEALLMQSLDDGLIVDGALAMSEAQRRSFWLIREDFEPEQKKYAKIYGYDVSLPIEAMEQYVDDVRSALLEKYSDASLYAYGHVGDGNIHFSIFPGEQDNVDGVNQCVYKPLKELKGSVSA